MTEERAGAVAWTPEEDDDGNTVWTAESPYTDTGGHPVFRWRLQQCLRNNQIVWVANHDPELGDWKGLWWETLEAAQEEVQAAHSRILEEHL